jgi:hypothetical protein
MFDFLSRRSAKPAHHEEPAARADEARQAVLAEIAAEETAWPQIAKEFDFQIGESQTRVAQLEKQLQAERVRLDALTGERLGRSLTHERTLGQLRMQLLRGASPVIDLFLHELVGLEERMRAAFEVRLTQGHPDPVTDRRPITVSTNNAAAVVEAIRAIRPQVEALCWASLSDHDVVRRLEELVASIPELDSAMPVDLTAALGLTPAQIREAEWRAAEPRETGRPWR